MLVVLAAGQGGWAQPLIAGAGLTVSPAVKPVSDGRETSYLKPYAARTDRQAQDPPPTRISPSGRLFKGVEFRTNSALELAPWRGVLKKIQAERGLYKRCENPDENCHPKLKAWRRLLTNLKHSTGTARLEQLNYGINKLVSYRPDEQVFGAPDYWASPAESLRFGGDCEDFAILKYVSLLELGMNENQLRIMVVNDKHRKIGHAILSVTENGRRLALDNLSDTPAGAHSVSNYQPVYSISGKSRWVHVSLTPVARKKAN